MTKTTPRVKSAFISSRAALLASCAVAASVAAAPAFAAKTSAGTLFLASSRYAGKAKTIAVGEPLPITPTADAIANGAYPTVFQNDTVDGNFGITAPIELEGYKVTTTGTGLEVGGTTVRTDVTNVTGVVTSFSSKSELSLHLSTDGSALTFMGYLGSLNAIDLSDSNTPGNYDPTNSDIAPSTFRTVVQYNLGSASFSTTPTNGYSGNNGRGAILAANVNGSGTDEYLMVGNGGNGSGIPATNVVDDTGVQSITPGAGPTTTVIGAQQGTPGQKDGFEFGFSVVSLGDPADKSGKDDNFRGSTIYNNTLYVTKGSGGNGVNTVYQVGTAGTLPTAATGATTNITILPGFPTGLAANITETNPATEFYPFGLYFANATTLYVADEGSQDLNADPNAGLQKWIFNGTTWNLAYTIQAGLNLDQPYTVPNYPSNVSPATTGLRHITGVVNGNQVTIFATTSTFSNLGDPGADPNSVVQIVDDLDATTLPAGESFSTLRPAAAGVVYRGVAFVPAAAP